MTTRTIDLNRFKDAVGFTATFRRFGNRRKGNKDKVTTSQDNTQDTKTKERITIQKELIRCKEYDAVRTYMGEVQRWIYEQTVPSFFKTGFQLASLAAVEIVEKKMRKAVSAELPVLVNDLIFVYPRAIEEAKAALGEQFNALDYPAAEELRGMFQIEWNWIAFTVPEGLPAELRAAEQGKLEKQFADAAEQITLALRESFQGLISHAIDRLTTAPGEPRKKFNDSVLANIQAFLDTFSQRNLLNDVDLARLVGEAKTVMLGLTPQKIRDYDNTRNGTRDKFAEIKTQLDGMVEEVKSRKFALEED